MQQRMWIVASVDCTTQKPNILIHHVSRDEGSVAAERVLKETVEKFIIQNDGQTIDILEEVNSLDKMKDGPFGLLDKKNMTITVFEKYLRAGKTFGLLGYVAKKKMKRQFYCIFHNQENETKDIEHVPQRLPLKLAVKQTKENAYADVVKELTEKLEKRRQSKSNSCPTPPPSPETAETCDLMTEIAKQGWKVHLNPMWGRKSFESSPNSSTLSSSSYEYYSSEEEEEEEEERLSMPIEYKVFPTSTNPRIRNIIETETSVVKDEPWVCSDDDVSDNDSSASYNHFFKSEDNNYNFSWYGEDSSWTDLRTPLLPQQEADDTQQVTDDTQKEAYDNHAAAAWLQAYQNALNHWKLNVDLCHELERLSSSSSLEF